MSEHSKNIIFRLLLFGGKGISDLTLVSLVNGTNVAKWASKLKLCCIFKGACSTCPLQAIQTTKVKA